MLRYFLPLLAGLMFGTGLIISGMTDPARILAFLDVAGAWNPSLALVMGSAILIAAPAFAWARRRGTTLLGVNLRLPNRGDIEPKLLIGSAAFGVGWGLSGFCPGPAVVSLLQFDADILLFVLMLAAGWLATDWWQNRLVIQPEAQSPAQAGRGQNCG